MLKVKCGEQSNVRYDVGLIQKSTLSAGKKGVVFFIDRDPMVLDKAWCGTLKRYIDVESSDFYSRHKDMIQIPKRYYNFLVLRLPVDDNCNIIGDSFSLEYLQMGGGTYKEFCDGSIAQPNYNGAILTFVEKSVEGKNLSYIKPYATTVSLQGALLEKVNKLINDKAEVERLWNELPKCMSLMSEAQFEAALSSGRGVQAQPVSQLVSQPASAPASKPQPAPTSGVSMDDFGNDSFGDLPF